MQSPIKDYREIIRFALERRIATNPRYSLRAFARDLGLSPSRISGVLNRKHGLSREKAAMIAEKLELSAEERSVFCDLVESEHARSSSKKALAQNRVKLQSALFFYSDISLERFRFISRWHHLAILESIHLKDFEPSPQWIADRLGIEVKEAKAAVQRLVKLGLLDCKGGKWRLPRRSNATPTDIPSDAIRDFHQQILEKAKTALFSQTTQERDFSAMVMSVPVSRIKEAKEDLKEFRRVFSKKYEDQAGCEEVYCLSSQFFKLTQAKEKR